MSNTDDARGADAQVIGGTSDYRSGHYPTPSISTGSPPSSRRTSTARSGYEYEGTSLLCGFGSCTPRWLQRFHTAKWLLAMLGVCAFVQSLVVNSIFPVGLSTLEKRFHMTSTQTGIISSWYDFAVVLAIFPVCHWGNTGHKGRWIGLGTFLMGLGSFICALPHYLVPPYVVGQSLNTTDYGQCMHRELNETCLNGSDDTAGYLNPYFLLFILGQTLHGVGSTPLFSIGTAYIDENVSQNASPVYLAIHAVVASIGPVVGLFIGGYFLTIYTDFDRVDMSTVPLKDSSDPRWVGAWWLGFLGCSVAAIMNAFPILMFAKELPEAKRHRMKDVDQVHAVSQVDETDEILKGNMKALPKAIGNILRNPTFVTCIVLGIFESIVINGFAAFMPKILETILSTTPTKASYLSALVIFAAAAGVMLGGAVIRGLKLQIGGMLKMILVCHVAALILITSFLIQCPARNFVGINVSYENTTAENFTGLSNMCNFGCDCKSEWNPVCDMETGNTYYSACHAGCHTKINGTTGDLWQDCGCVADTASGQFLEIVTTGPRAKSVVSGFCTRECGWRMWVFLVLLFFSVVASFASGIPSQQIMLRVIPFQQRALGIGVHWTFLRLLGFIPGGVLFGLMIDTTCLEWQKSTCGKKQSCLVHDPNRLSWTIMAVAVVCKLVSILATIIGYMTYRPNDLDSGVSVYTTDSRGPLSLTVNDDRLPAETAKKSIPNGNQVYVPTPAIYRHSSTRKTTDGTTAQSDNSSDEYPSAPTRL
uniref:Solute carrier organic anion transporter family member n=1 Tax=Panagrellus redivivus TaxID=6233 RepID=A0A7E4WBR8_PANRE